MPTYLILKRTGPGDLDVRACAVIRGKTAAEVDDAIREGATEGEGDYIALGIDSKAERKVVMRADVGPADPLPPA